MTRTILCLALLLSTIGWTGFRSAYAAPEQGSGQNVARREKLLRKFDANGNGQLDPDEREAAREAKEKRASQGGGKGAGGGKGQGKGKGQSDPERRAKLLERFDADGDGKLDESERAAAKEARAQRER